MQITVVRLLNIYLPMLLVILWLFNNLAYGQRQVLVQDTFNPAFQIEPLVQRLSGRRGEVLHFQFTLQTLNRDTDIEMLKVGLRQDITGQILQDDRGGENNPIEILGSAARTVLLAAVSARGTPLTNVIVQPESFTLSAGRSRKVSLTLRTQSNVEQPVEFGTLQIKSTDSTQQYAHTGMVPLAIILGHTKEPQLNLQPLRFVADTKYPCFRTIVTNQGAIHAPLDARLLIASESGQRRILTGGFGKWLLPGESANLEFRLDRELTAGNYQIVCELENGQDPIVKKQAITVTDFENAKPAK